MNSNEDDKNESGPIHVYPEGTLQRSPEDIAMRLSSECESDFPHELFEWDRVSVEEIPPDKR